MVKRNNGEKKEIKRMNNCRLRVADNFFLKSVSTVPLEK